MFPLGCSNLTVDAYALLFLPEYGPAVATLPFLKVLLLLRNESFAFQAGSCWCSHATESSRWVSTHASHGLADSFYRHVDANLST
ncbi:hypothetical protein Taro_049744 [Colocasia esculenta]|uniref:Uncharacterized protein n=1 Tax=Colocasia esculenta TaxID=4460 RepID=A0A843XBL1_COLES|nr:hypothetical protein [Colocasia esculenta]